MFGNLKELPIPVGKYTVGVKQMDFIDQSRKQVFDFEDTNSFRELPVVLYYPSDSNEGKQCADYMPAEVANVMSKTSHRLVSKNIYKIKTHCYKEIAISTKKDNFPVILFNHGYGTYIESSTILLSNLASAGYIVVSIGHPYEAVAVKYLDGRVVKQHKDAIKRMNLSESDFKKSKVIELDELATELSKYVHDVNNPFENFKIWQKDSSFILDELENLNTGKIESIFKNKLNLGLGVGIFGHSFGGTTAVQTCLKDKRVKCGINLDGSGFCNDLFNDIKKPFMFIGSRNTGKTMKIVHKYNSEDSSIVLVGDTEHSGYTDGLFIARQLNLFNLIGKREKYDFNEIYTKYVMSFFDKYLLSNDDIEFIDIKYDNVDFEEKKKSLV
ncbi:MAG: hypothetical protein QM489_07465, partial [Candidatus Izemoplasma sp.]